MASLTKLFILILIASSAQSALFFRQSVRSFDENHLQPDKITNFLSNLKHTLKEARLFNALDELDSKGTYTDQR